MSYEVNRYILRCDCHRSPDPDTLNRDIGVVALILPESYLQ